MPYSSIANSAPYVFEGNTAPLPIRFEVYGGPVDPLSTNNFKFEFQTSAGTWQITGNNIFTITEGSVNQVIDGTVANPLQNQAAPFEVTPKLYEELTTGVWTLVPTDMPVLSVPVGPIYVKSPYSNYINTIYSGSPNQIYDVNNFKCYWEGQTPKQTIISVETHCVPPTLMNSNAAPTFSFNKTQGILYAVPFTNLPDSILLNNSTIQDDTNGNLSALTTAYNSMTLVPVAQSILQSVFDLWPGDSYISYDFQTSILKNAWTNPCSSFRCFYLLRNLITTPASISISAGDRSIGLKNTFQFAQKIDTLITVSSSNANVVISPIDGQGQENGSVQTFRFVPDGTTDEVGFYILGQFQATTVTISETAYTPPTTTAITSGQVVTSSIVNGLALDGFMIQPAEYFTMHITAGQLVTAEMAALWDFAYAIKDPDGYTIADIYGGSLLPQFTARTTGTYKFICSSSWDGARGSYTFTVTVV